METKELIRNDMRIKILFNGLSIGLGEPIRAKRFAILLLTLIALSSLLVNYSNENQVLTVTASSDQHIIERAVSDEAQRNTISFDGLGFMTGNFGSQTFLPPGKVADYSGFQYLRDTGHSRGTQQISADSLLFDF